MKKAALLIALCGLVMTGCGVKKDYVDAQINEAEARLNSKVSAVQQKADNNQQEIAKMQTLAEQLRKDTDMAINKAAGFESYQILWEGQINFAFDSWTVDDVAAQILSEAGQKLEEVKGSVIEIAGHTDQTGSSKYNLMLGEQRASAAKLYLADNFGISLYRMFIISFGEKKPTSMPDERNSASKNRRVSLTVWGNPNM